MASRSERHEGEGVRRAPDALVQANPRVDAVKLRDAERLVNGLRQRGMPPPAPSVSSPYGQPLTKEG
jgi:hypothetical protein